MIAENKKKYSILLPADLGFSSSVRKITESILSYLQVDEKEIFRLILVMDELFMNAVLHGSSSDPVINSSIHISFIFEKGKKLIVIVEDEGTGEKISPQDIREKMTLEFQRHDPKKHSGRGLAQIALNLTSDFLIENSQYGGIKISFMKQL